MQVRYLFGAPATVLGGTTTFADYARRGFAELVVAAAASLLLLLGLAGLSRRSHPVARRTFAGLAAGLTGLVLVILASAFRRLLLYEAAFGFTRARVWAHLFMVVLGWLLVVLLAAVVTDRLRSFLQATGAAVLVFAITLTAVNVDALVAARNVERASAGAELDGAYLSGLSSDAVPALVAAEARADPALRASLSAVIACHAEPLHDDRPWQSANLSRWRARRALAARPADPGGCALEARPYP